jgi:hypothetical protein
MMFLFWALMMFLFYFSRDVKFLLSPNCARRARRSGSGEDSCPKTLLLPKLGTS